MTKYKPPTQLAVWNQEGQPCTDQEIRDVVKFKKSFEVWWMELQPAAHTKGGCLQSVRDNIDWRKMNKAGRRGFVVVMLLLTWWRAACSKAKSDQWELMVNNDKPINSV